MIKFVGEDIWCFDAEWVPDVAAGRRLYDLDAPIFLDAENNPLPSPDVDSVPGAVDYTGWLPRDVISYMFEKDSNFNRDTNPRPFLKTILCRVVALAFVRERGDKVTLHMIEAGDERTLLELFLHQVGKHSPQLVGWNTRDADVPALIQRAMVHGIEARGFCKRPDKPWLGRDYFAKDNDFHVDVLREISGFGRSTPNLSEACAAMNIVGPKTMTGADVLDLWLAGDPASLRRIQLYCLLDCVRLYLIWLRLGRLAGFYPEDVARENAASALRQYEELADPPSPQPESEERGNHEGEVPQREGGN